MTRALLLSVLLAGCLESAGEMPRLTACAEQADAWCGSDSGACARVWVDQWCDPPHWEDPVSTAAQDACLDAIAALSSHRDVPVACWRTWVRRDGFGVSP